MKITFDEKGNLEPYHLISMNLTTLEANFVYDFPNSNKRKILFQNLINYQLDLRNLLKMSFIQWIDGSFVSNKLNPQDIDLVNLIGYDREDNPKGFVEMKIKI
jgi:hypothetical protein